MRRNRREHNIKNIIIQYIAENVRSYLILIIIFFIGLMLGVVFVNNLNSTQETQITGYINNFISSIKENYQISTSKLLWNSLLNNVSIAIILWFLGLTIIGVPIIYLCIGYKGFGLGFTIASCIATLGTGKGILFTILMLLLQNIILIPSILTLATSGINVYKLIMEDRRRENIKLQIAKHTIFSVLILGLLILSSIVETYISGKIGIMLLKYMQ